MKMPFMYLWPFLDEISNKEIDLGKYTEENFELKDQNRSLEEELNRSQSECSQLRDHVHSLSMTGLQDAPDGDVRGFSLFQGTGNFFFGYWFQELFITVKLFDYDNPT